MGPGARRPRKVDQRMGRPAQDAFKLQCSSAGITCNPSLEDDYGWDFMVEISQEVGAETPHDSEARSAVGARASQMDRRGAPTTVDEG